MKKIRQKVIAGMSEFRIKGTSTSFGCHSAYRRMFELPAPNILGKWVGIELIISDEESATSVPIYVKSIAGRGSALRWSDVSFSRSGRGKTGVDGDFTAKVLKLFGIKSHERRRLHLSIEHD